MGRTTRSRRTLAAARLVFSLETHMSQGSKRYGYFSPAIPLDLRFLIRIGAPSLPVDTLRADLRRFWGCRRSSDRRCPFHMGACLQVGHGGERRNRSGVSPMPLYSRGWAAAGFGSEQQRCTGYHPSFGHTGGHCADRHPVVWRVRCRVMLQRSFACLAVPV